MSKKKINVDEVRKLQDYISQSISTHKAALHNASGASYSYLLGGLISLRDIDTMLERLLINY